MKKNYLLPASILAAALIIASAWIYTAGLKVSVNSSKTETQGTNSVSIVQRNVAPSSGGGCGI